MIIHYIYIYTIIYIYTQLYTLHIYIYISPRHDVTECHGLCSKFSWTLPCKIRSYVLPIVCDYHGLAFASKVCANADGGVSFRSRDSCGKALCERFTHRRRVLFQSRCPPPTKSISTDGWGLRQLITNSASPDLIHKIREVQSQNRCWFRRQWDEGGLFEKETDEALPETAVFARIFSWKGWWLPQNSVTKSGRMRNRTKIKSTKRR